MRQLIKLHVEPVVSIKVVRLDRSRIRRREIIVLEIESHDGKNTHTLAEGDTLNLNFIGDLEF